jgi:CRP-like cAMP-binding protein
MSLGDGSWTDVEGELSLDTEDRNALSKSELGRYWDEKYESEGLRFMLRDRKALPLRYAGAKKSAYKTKNVIPDWIANTKQWRATKVKNDNNDVAHIFLIPVAERSVEQNSQLVHFVMDTWKTAADMGLKKSTQMLHVFKYVSYDPGQHIITEGDEGLTFFIIISGSTNVHKDGIGVVAKLGAGKSFGELAIIKGDVRTASIIADTRVECLSLHKSDYDHFLKDIQNAEKRENFYLLRDSKLFEGWPRAKIDKLSSTCQRKTIEEGHVIFKQDAETDCVYVIMDGSVDIVKEVIIESRNAWPMAMDSWEENIKRVVKPVLMASLSKGDHFGEISIMQARTRGASAVATSRTILLSIEKLEFLHMMNSVGALSAQMDQGKVNMLNRYPKDEQILGLVGNIRGGPTSFARSGPVTIYPNKSKDQLLREERAEKLKKISTRRAQQLNQASISTAGSPESKGHQISAKEAKKLKEMRLAHETSSQELRKQEEAAISAVLRSQALGVALLEHSKHVGNTAEMQAKREMEEAQRVLVEATKHSRINEDPIFHLRGKFKVGKGWGFDSARARRTELLELPPVTNSDLEKGWR